MPLKSRGEYFCGWKQYSCRPQAYRSKWNAAGEGIWFEVNPRVISEQRYEWTICTFVCRNLHILLLLHWNYWNALLLFECAWSRVNARVTFFSQLSRLRSLMNTHQCFTESTGQRVKALNVFVSLNSLHLCLTLAQMHCSLYSGCDALLSPLFCAVNSFWRALLFASHIDQVILYLQLNVTESRFPLNSRFYRCLEFFYVEWMFWAPLLWSLKW